MATPMGDSPFFSGIQGFNPEWLQSRIAPRLPHILTWGLGIALGVQTAVIVRDLIPQKQLQTSTVAGVSAMHRPTPHTPLDLQSILNAHLFGVAAPDRPAGDPANAPQTRLSLVLTGTIAVKDPQAGFGIIGESAASAKVYAVGNAVPGGARLHSVYPDRVLLESGGQLEALLLPHQTPPAGDVPRAPPPSAGAALTERLRHMMAQDPGSLSEILRPQPVFANGQQRGYRVYPGRNRQQFMRLGLRPGDLIMSINGTPLDDPARGMEIFRTMNSATEVRVVVERGGNPQELVLNMAQLANQAQELGNSGPGTPPAEAPSVNPADPTPPNPEQ
jgi:general secretion pathway protein C